MSTISVTLPADGQTIDAADVNTPINTIVTEINGNLNSQNIADSGVTPNELMSGAGSSWAWQSYTPTLTNATVGNGTLTASYCQIGKTVFVRFSFLLGSTSTMGTGILFSLPVTATTLSTNDVIGYGNILDSGVGFFAAIPLWNSTTTAIINTQNTAGTYLTQVQCTSTVPMTWTTNDRILCYLIYEAA